MAAPAILSRRRARCRPQRIIEILAAWSRPRPTIPAADAPRSSSRAPDLGAPLLSRRTPGPRGRSRRPIWPRWSRGTGSCPSPIRLRSAGSWSCCWPVWPTTPAPATPSAESGDARQAAGAAAQPGAVCPADRGCGVSCVRPAASALRRRPGGPGRRLSRGYVRLAAGVLRHLAVRSPPARRMTGARPASPAAGALPAAGRPR